MTDDDGLLPRLMQQLTRMENALGRIETHLMAGNPDGQAPVIDLEESVFISYRRSDSAYITGRIYDRLSAHFGAGNVFLDVDDILLGRDFTLQLQQQLEVCDLLLVIIGPTWLNVTDAETGERRLDNQNDVVRQEVQIGLRRDIPVIPVLVRGTQMPDEAELPFRLKPLADKSGTAIRPDPNFHTDVEQLIFRILQTLQS